MSIVTKILVIIFLIIIAICLYNVMIILWSEHNYIGLSALITVIIGTTILIPGDNGSDIRKKEEQKLRDLEKLYREP